MIRLAWRFSKHCSEEEEEKGGIRRARKIIYVREKRIIDHHAPGPTKSKNTDC